jgi:hypothetical protein
MMDNKGIYEGVYYCNLNRNEELNKRISNRNIPSGYLEAKFSPRPVSTKYSLLPVVDQYKKANVPIITTAPYNVGQIFNPGNDQAPWSGFATNIDVESILRNEVFALQRADQAAYIPSSNSDLYKVEVQGQPIQQPFPGLFANPVLAPFNPNQLGLGGDIFNNSTRQQLKDTK